jgi:hypothetical protein
LIWSKLMLRAREIAAIACPAVLISLALQNLYATPTVSSRSSPNSTLRVADITCTEETKFIGDKSDYCGANEKKCDQDTATVTLTSDDYTDANGKKKSRGLILWPGGNAPLGDITFDYSDAPNGCKTYTNYQGVCAKKTGKQFTTSDPTGTKGWLEEVNCSDFVWTGPCTDGDIAFVIYVHIPADKLKAAKDLGIVIDEGGYTTVLGQFYYCYLDSNQKQSVRCDGGGNTTMLIAPSATCPGQ